MTLLLLIRGIHSTKILSRLRASLIPPSVSVGFPKRYFFSCSSLPASSPRAKFPCRGSNQRNTSPADHGSAWLCHRTLLFSTRDAFVLKSHLNRQQDRFFSSTRVALAASVCAEELPDASSGQRITRSDRTDAQNAFVDYLHVTRGLPFMDAEHISKNSPEFLQRILAKIDNDDDVGRSLSRYLRYHPINEFEPFFESLGLNPSEIQPLLPRNLMFLEDDDVLLENYNILCNYGVPRRKIGKMYKEETEIFRYDFGVLHSKLCAYEALGLSKPTMINLVTCCPSLLVGGVNANFHKVLGKLKSLGIELDWIRGCLSDKSFYNWKWILGMLNFLDGIGCDKNELSSLVRNNPNFVFDDSGKKIYIVVAILLKLGLRKSNILVLFVQYPQILAGNFTKNLLQSVHFLAEIGMLSDDIASILSSHAQVLGSCSCKKPDVVLTDLNVSKITLCEIIKEDPSQFGTLVSKKKVDVLIFRNMDGHFLQEKTNFLLKLGFIENSDEMAKALGKFRGRGDQLQERLDVLVNAGLDCNTVSQMIKAVPAILNQSIDSIEKKIDFLLNHMGYSIESLVDFPAFLCYNIDKIKLRFTMYAWLKERKVTTPRKAVHSNVALSTILACSDTRFVKYVVNLHPDGPNEWEKLKLGFIENSEEMAKALGKFRGRGDQLQETLDVLVNAGLDCNTVSQMIKAVPAILNQSIDTIEKKIDFLLNHMGYSIESLVNFPAFLCYNIDKMKLRFTMYAWLKERKVTTPRKTVHSNVALSTILACSNTRFVKCIVNLHPDGPNEWEKLKNSFSSK
ncbi:transcription termination factor MTEF18, mitochondrial-like [Zingiber officinale]|uniref:transcription termination factor MTEF18, mitochondrial-like n=1 Tax=Zingiber officinale TaxID=94328 RepID=UPI001C4BF6DC|nr:transcription termination factor MTEF18, mitochondrial-like [Zingiber officinale]